MNPKIENRENAKLLTLTAFLLGYALIDNLSSTEQNALGGFFMLVGQTLSTNSGYHFNNDWNKRMTNTTNTEYDTVDLLKKANAELTKQINNLSN